MECQLQACCFLMQEHAEELAHLESLDNGKPLAVSRAADVPLVGTLLMLIPGTQPVLVASMTILYVYTAK